MNTKDATSVDLTPADIRRLALVGARAEMERILTAFPQLAPAAPKAAEPPPAKSDGHGHRGRHWARTTAGRRKMSRLMKRKWAERREVKRKIAALLKDEG